MTSIRARRHALAGALLATTFCGGVVQQAFAQIEEIVVTTRKRAENLQDIPIVVTAFTAETMTRKGIADLEDVIGYVPGISLEEGFSKQDTRITIRGLSPTRGRQNAAVLIDDVDISSEAIATAGGSAFINPRLFDVERVEVVKGPHSALYGRSAFAGAVSYITKKPGDTPQANASVEAGSFGKLEGRASASGPVVEGKLALGGSVAVWTQNGMYTNSVSGRKVGGFDGHGASVSATFTPTEALKLTMRGEYSDDHFDPEARTFIQPTPNSLTLPASAVGQGIPNITAATTTTSGVFGRIPDVAGLPLVRLSKNPRTGEDYPGDDRRLKTLSLRTEYATEVVSLQSITFYSKADLTQFHDTLGAGDATALTAIQETHFVTDRHVLSQDFRMQSADDSAPLTWTVGGLFWNEVARQNGRSNACLSTVGGCATILSGLGVTRPYFTSPNRYTRDTHHYSAYGLAEYEIIDGLRASIEARYSWEDEKVASTVNSTLIGCTGGQRFRNPATGIITCLVPAPQTQTPSATGLFGTQTKDEFFTPRFSIDYKFSDDQMVYASVGKGEKPAGSLSLLAPTTAGDYSATKYIPEKLWVYELGLKAEFFDKRVRTNADVYYQDFKNKQETGTRVGNDGLPVPGPGNAEKARVYGFEFDGTAVIADFLTVNGGYSYIDSKYKVFNLIQTTASNIALGGNCTVVRPATGTPYCSVSYAGKELALSPKHSFNVGASFKQEFAPDVDYLIEIDARYMGKRFTTFDNATTLSSYFVTDVRAGFEAERWSLIGYVNNLLKDDSLRQGGVGLPDFNSSFIIPIFPGVSSGFLANLPDKRQFGVRASYRF